jgi:hypothetical protein
MKEARGRTSGGIMKWFKYLTTYFMSTTPIWSNLLLGNASHVAAKSIGIISLYLGDLSRHSRRMVRSFEGVIIHNEEQRTTAISERRMGILKRHQLGNTKKTVR